jgi:hypothetical protein
MSSNESKSDDLNPQKQQPSSDTTNEGGVRVRKRTMSGVTESRADSKINDSHVHSSSGGGNGGGGDHDAEDESTSGAPRLVLRNLPYAQSCNHIQVRHNYTAMKIYKLIQHDWFHVLLRFPTSQSLFFLISIWTLFLVIWAGCYVWVDRSNIGVECGLGPNGASISFRGAFAFSLQTCTTGRFYNAFVSYPFFPMQHSQQVSLTLVQSETSSPPLDVLPGSWIHITKWIERILQ